MKIAGLLWFRWKCWENAFIAEFVEKGRGERGENILSVQVEIYLYADLD